MSIFDVFSSRGTKSEKNPEKVKEKSPSNEIPNDDEINNYCQKILNSVNTVYTDAYEIQNIIIYLQREYQNMISSKNYDVNLDSSYYFMRTKLENTSDFIGKEILNEAFNFLQMSINEKKAYVIQNNNKQMPEFRPVTEDDLADFNKIFDLQKSMTLEESVPQVGGEEIEFLSPVAEEQPGLDPRIEEPTMILNNLDLNAPEVNDANTLAQTDSPTPEVVDTPFENEQVTDLNNMTINPFVGQDIYNPGFSDVPIPEIANDASTLAQIDSPNPEIVDTPMESEAITDLNNMAVDPFETQDIYTPEIPDVPVAEVDENPIEEKPIEENHEIGEEPIKITDPDNFIPFENIDMESVGLDDIDKYIANANTDEQVETPENKDFTYSDEVSSSMEIPTVEEAPVEPYVINTPEEIDSSKLESEPVEETESNEEVEEPALDVKVVEAMDMDDINSYIDGLTDGLAEEFSLPDESIGKEVVEEEKSTVENPLNEDKQKASLTNSIEHITFEQKIHNYEITRLDILKDIKQIELDTFGAYYQDEIANKFPEDYAHFDKYRQKVKLLETKKYPKNLDQKIDELAHDIKVLTNALRAYQLYQRRYKLINNIRTDKLEEEENLRKIYNLIHAKENADLKNKGSLYDAWDLSDKKIPQEYQGKTYEEVEQMLKDKQTKEELDAEALFRESLTEKAIRKDLGVKDDYYLTDTQIKNLRKQFDRLSLDELKEFLGIMPDNLTDVQKENISAYNEEKKAEEARKQELIDNIFAILYPNISEELAPIARKPLEQYNVLELEDIERFYKNELKEKTRS